MGLAVMTVATQVLASSGSSDSDPRAWGLLLLLAGPAFYISMYLRYRNTDKRHKHEIETRATLHDVRASDTFHKSLTRLSNARMNGANNTEVRGARTGLAASLGLDNN
ncbi:MULTISPECIES: growth/differentiation factor [unclassified Actinotalea]|uniref:growth/differentiation factor n=1 Tax=unclassified Actinotalea TaxID=2638618 RepID=UPI0015F60C27|nr:MULTISPECIES: growth/differentiation factor [unclassified Actinotalea]